MSNFSYDEAFSRNLGWVTATEQQVLRGKRIAIAGMGGVGGSHLLTLTRLGIGAFHIADFDRFELANFNRQAGARLSSVGELKAATLSDMARDINPELDIKIFADGITEENLDAFLKDVDVYVDGLDFFVLEMRRKIFARCHQLGIPAVTAAPAGMGAAYLIFKPGEMSFEEYFRLEGLPKQKQMVNFLLGLTPAAFQSSYLVDPSRINLAAQKVPSTGLACELCAGVVAAQVLKLMLYRGPVHAAPYYHHFDAYRNEWKRGRLRGGLNHPLQRLKLRLAYRHFEKIAKATPPATEYTRDIERILDLARWAPSGDNVQPWRFTITDDEHVTVRILTAKARSNPDFYDLNNGQPTLISGGVLLETIRIAASVYGRSATWNYVNEKDGVHTIDVTFTPVNIKPDPLATVIKTRSVDRRPYRATPLSVEQKTALTAALGDDFAITWFEPKAERRTMAKINAMATDIRLRVPEAFPTHAHVLDWNNASSTTGIPTNAIGLDTMTLSLMKFLMKDWKRVHFMNRFGGGTGVAQLEMDMLPGVSCAAHFVVRHKTAPANSAETFLKVGQAMQRFWLTAAAHGLVLQPSTAAQMFGWAGKHHYAFTTDAKMLAKATTLSSTLAQQIKGDVDSIGFMGRIGQPKAKQPKGRSIRLPLAEL